MLKDYWAVFSMPGYNLMMKDCRVVFSTPG
jgi:hypothetical protein